MFCWLYQDVTIYHCCVTLYFKTTCHIRPYFKVLIHAVTRTTVCSLLRPVSTWSCYIHLQNSTCICHRKVLSVGNFPPFPVSVPPYIDSTNLDNHPRVIKGKIIVLHCPAIGIPFPNVTWLRDGEPIHQNRRTRFLLSGRQLEILDAHQRDSSRYTCVAANIAGTVDMDFDLHVLGRKLGSGKKKSTQNLYYDWGGMVENTKSKFWNKTSIWALSSAKNLAPQNLLHTLSICENSSLSRERSFANEKIKFHRPEILGTGVYIYRFSNLFLILIKL